MSTVKELAKARIEIAEKWQQKTGALTRARFLEGFDAAVEYLSEPNAMRFLANETITKENDALKGVNAHLIGLLRTVHKEYAMDELLSDELMESIFQVLRLDQEAK